MKTAWDPLAPERWTAVSDAFPTLSVRNRRGALWLYDARGVDVVFRGGYVDFGLCEAAADQGHFCDKDGNPAEATHFTAALSGEGTPPPPPTG